MGVLFEFVTCYVGLTSFLKFDAASVQESLPLQGPHQLLVPSWFGIYCPFFTACEVFILVDSMWRTTTNGCHLFYDHATDWCLFCHRHYPHGAHPVLKRLPQPDLPLDSFSFMWVRVSSLLPFFGQWIWFSICSTEKCYHLIATSHNMSIWIFRFYLHQDPFYRIWC